MTTLLRTIPTMAATLLLNGTTTGINYRYSLRHHHFLSNEGLPQQRYPRQSLLAELPVHFHIFKILIAALPTSGSTRPSLYLHERIHTTSLHHNLNPEHRPVNSRPWQLPWIPSYNRRKATGLATVQIHHKPFLPRPPQDSPPLDLPHLEQTKIEDIGALQAPPW